MKNTTVPLDTAFADCIGKIVQINETARPYDETPILGGKMWNLFKKKMEFFPSGMYCMLGQR